MKKRYLFSFLFYLIPIAIFSQSYIAFPDSNARWVNYERHIGSFISNYDIFCMEGEDTLINSTRYTKVNRCAGSYFLMYGYVGGIRDTLGKVYFIHKDSTAESLLYDFTVNLGDSIYSVYNTPTTTIPLVVSLIDSVMINGSQRKRIHIQNGFKWIEGIGNTAGLFQSSWIPLSTNVSLYCMSYDSTSLSGFNTGLLQSSPGNCSLTVGLEEASETEEQISIYPNPASDWVKIESPEQIRQVFIYDKQARLLRVENSNSFSIQNLSNGLYFLRIESESGVYFEKLLKRD